jgi:hypothetical protein
MTRRRMDKIPLTAVFRYFMGSPAKPGNTTMRGPIQKKAPLMLSANLALTGFWEIAKDEICASGRSNRPRSLAHTPMGLIDHSQ